MDIALRVAEQVTMMRRRRSDRRGHAGSDPVEQLFTTFTWDVITPPMSETEATQPLLRVDGLDAYYSGAHVLHGVVRDGPQVGRDHRS
jgi:hypothetical protein